MMLPGTAGFHSAFLRCRLRACDFINLLLKAPLFLFQRRNLGLCG
jgi:hypothetical protein